MAFLQAALDDATAAPCGRCDNCAGAWFPVEVGAQEAGAASEALDQVGVPIEPRSLWPTGAERLGVPVKGRIAVEERPEQGRALARLTDLGWGGTLRALFAAGAGVGADDAPVSREVLAACTRVLADWPWRERPVAVASVPSRSRPVLVESIAEGLARVGKLAYLGSLTPVNGGPAGEPGGNSAYRLAGVWERLSAERMDVPTGPVLLVDDLVDSRWTVTVAARALRQAGATAVLPFALALRA